MDINDKFGLTAAPGEYAVATTVKTARTPGETVLAGFDLSTWTKTTPAFFVTYKKVTDPETNEVTQVNQLSWKALVNPDNNTLTNLELAPGYADIGNAVGDYIEPIPTAFWADSLVQGLQVSLNPDGTPKDKEVLPQMIRDDFGDHVVGGTGIISAGAGLTGKMSNAVFYHNGYRYTKNNIPDRALTASRDTYVFLHTDGTVTYTAVANNAAQPATPTNSILAGKFVTDATKIVSVTPINNGAVKSQNVDFTTFAGFSYTETATSQRWIDGKIVYQKTIAIGALPSNSTPTSTAHGITGIAQVVGIEGIGIRDSQQVSIPLPNTATALANMVEVYRSGANVMVVSGGANRSEYNGFITLRYTKS